MLNGLLSDENLSKSLNLTLENHDISEENEIESSTDHIIARINLGIMVFGVLGNLICILVFSQKSLLNRRFNWYFLALSFADLIFCFILFTNYLVYELSRRHRLSIDRIPLHLYDLSELTCILYEYMVNSMDAFSVFLTLTLSIDRLYAITNPIKVRMFITYRFPKQIILIIYLALHFIKSPEIFLSGRKFINEDESSVPNQFNSSSSIKSFVCFPSSNIDDAYNSTGLFIYVIYSNIFLPVTLNILPGLIIVMLNMTLWFFIRHYTNQISSHKLLNFGDQSLHLKSNTHRITKTQKSHYLTIIMIGVWLLLTTIPYYSLCTYYWFIAVKNLGDIHNPNETFLKAQAISSVFYNLNHCMNVIIYIFFHRDFRSNTLNLFIKCFNMNPVVKINPLLVRSDKAKKKVRIKKDSNSSHSSVTMGPTTNINSNYTVNAKHNSNNKKYSNEKNMNNVSSSRYEYKRNSRLKTVNDFNRISNNGIDEKSPMSRLTVNNNRNERSKSLSMQTISMIGSKQSVVMINNPDKIFMPNQKFFIFKYLNKNKEKKVELGEKVDNKVKLLEKKFNR